jgi:hypothetical protein
MDTMKSETKSRKKSQLKRAVTIVIATACLLIAGHQLLRTWAAMRDQAHANEPSARQRPAVVTNMTPGGMNGVFQTLNLTADQQPKVEAILNSVRTGVSAVRNNAALSQQAKRAKMQELMQAGMQKMKAVLKRDQMQKLEQMHHMQSSGNSGSPNDHIH